MYCQRQSDNLINKIHERGLRIAYNDYTSDFKALQEKDCSVKIHQRNIQTLALEIFKTKIDLSKLHEKYLLSSKSWILYKKSKSCLSKSEDCMAGYVWI